MSSAVNFDSVTFNDPKVRVEHGVLQTRLGQSVKCTQDNREDSCGLIIVNNSFFLNVSVSNLIMPKLWIACKLFFFLIIKRNVYISILTCKFAVVCFYYEYYFLLCKILLLKILC